MTQEIFRRVKLFPRSIKIGKRWPSFWLVSSVAIHRRLSVYLHTNSSSLTLILRIISLLFETAISFFCVCVILTQRFATVRLVWCFWGEGGIGAAYVMNRMKKKGEHTGRRRMWQAWRASVPVVGYKNKSECEHSVGIARGYGSLSLSLSVCVCVQAMQSAHLTVALVHGKTAHAQSVSSHLEFSAFCFARSAGD